MQKHYIIYKITNLLDGKFYIGQHITSDLDDGYMGSGIQIRRAIKKHGRANFIREILFNLSSQEEMNQKEAELVTEDLVNDPMCYNLATGGKGGWTEEMRTNSIKNRSPEGWQKFWSAGGKSACVKAREVLAERYKDPVFREEHKASCVKANAASHSPEAKEKRKQNRQQKIDAGWQFMRNDDLKKRKFVSPDMFETYQSQGWRLLMNQQDAVK